MFGRPSHRRLLMAAAVSLGVLTAGCGRDEAAAPPIVDQREMAETLSTNPFIPEDVNIGDCVSSLPRPGCGNDIRGDSHSLLTFGALVAGLAFIGWRISRSVRRRDAPRPTTGSPSTATPSSAPPASGTPASDSPASDSPASDSPTSGAVPGD